MRAPLLACIGFLLLAGCSSSQEIRTRPPVAAPSTQAPQAVTEVSVVLEKGETALPEAVQELSFTLTALELRGAERRMRWPLGNRVVRLRRNQTLSLSLLNTTLPVATYDTLVLHLTNARVMFGPNAGGPLISDIGETLTLSLSFQAQENQSATLVVRFEPEPSLWRDARCTWHFTPFFLVNIQETSVSSR